MPRRKRTTLRAIADALNISPGTVSRSLREYPGVHPELRQRVRAMAGSMGYIPRQEQEPRDFNGKRNKIGVIVGDMVVLNAGAVDTSYIAYHFLSGLGQAGNECGAVLSIKFLNAATLDEAADPQRELGFVGDVEGVVLIYPLPEPFVERLVRVTNVVSLEHAYPTLPLDVIAQAQAVDVMRGVERLYQLGHRRIGYTADDAARGNRLPQTLRFAGYLSALRRAGLEYRQEDVLGMPGPAVPRHELATAVIDRVKAGVTALVCSTDRQAYLLCKELQVSGIHVPQHLSIIGMGGVSPMEGVPQLTMYRTPFETLGKAAIERLRGRRKQPDASPVLKEYPGTFVEGTSIGPPRATH